MCLHVCATVCTYLVSCCCGRAHTTSPPTVSHIIGGDMRRMGVRCSLLRFKIRSVPILSQNVPVSLSALNSNVDICSPLPHQRPVHKHVDIQYVCNHIMFACMFMCVRYMCMFVTISRPASLSANPSQGEDAARYFADCAEASATFAASKLSHANLHSLNYPYQSLPQL